MLYRVKVSYVVEVEAEDEDTAIELVQNGDYAFSKQDEWSYDIINGNTSLSVKDVGA